MGDIVFEWDDQKAWSNERKHGVSFDEAQTAFYDDHARLTYDPDNSQEEDRFLLLGMSAAPRLLVVCHVYRQADKYIRIISARKATKRETLKYRDFL